MPETKKMTYSSRNIYTRAVVSMEMKAGKRSLLGHFPVVGGTCWSLHRILHPVPFCGSS